LGDTLCASFFDAQSFLHKISNGAIRSAAKASLPLRCMATKEKKKRVVDEDDLYGSPALPDDDDDDVIEYVRVSLPCNTAC
jgi:hypothetical protein